ncbi:MAG: hypothetical protein J6Z08_08775 [Elusimicrobiales bacterium]|jgi:TolB-like protein|nr:hypothetical protein [Elusimicrobiales bacterium]
MDIKKILLISALSVLAMMPAVSVSAKKNSALEDELSRVSRRIAHSEDIPADAKFAFMDFCETTTAQRLNLSYAIEDELSIALIREMPGRLLIKNNTDLIFNELSATRRDVFRDLENLKRFSKKAEANYLISGNYYFDSEYAVININVIRTCDGIILFSERISIKRTDLPKTVLPEAVE